MNKKIIPVLCIFDYNKTLEFYVNWLGFSIDWEHRCGDNFPVYAGSRKPAMGWHFNGGC